MNLVEAVYVNKKAKAIAPEKKMQSESLRDFYQTGKAVEGSSAGLRYKACRGRVMAQIAVFLVPNSYFPHKSTNKVKYFKSKNVFQR